MTRTAQGALRFLRGRSVAQFLAGKQDNLIALRLCAALLVIFGHSWAVSRGENPVDWLTRKAGVFSGTIAVDVFFVVSGLLVTMSCARRNSMWAFVLARGLRIFPALICCVAITTFLLGAVMTTLPFHAYIRQSATRKYLFDNIRLVDLQWTLPGVFDHNHLTGIVNGSLWTLPAELQMYGYVLAFGLVGLLRNRIAFAIALGSLCGLAIAKVPYVRLVTLADYLPFAGYFAFGGLCYVYRDRVLVSGAAVTVLVALCVLLHGGSGYQLTLAATIAYTTLWCAFTPIFNRWRPTSDYSYGIYLYAFPVQQTWAALYPDWGPWQIFFVSAPSTALLGAMSWHWIERPALLLKVALSVRRERARNTKVAMTSVQDAAG